MRAINHALTGAAIGLAVGEPLVAVPLSLVSHYALDVMPHYGGGRPENAEMNSKTFRGLLLLDICLCPLLVLVLAIKRPDHWLLAAICAFVAAAPDLASINVYRSARSGQQPKPNRYIRFAHDIQWFERPIGAVVEVAWFIAMLVILVPLFTK
jgi:hypothetical protein